LAQYGVKTQRTLYKSEKLEAGRVTRLEALPDWTWDPYQAAWEKGFAVLTAYVAREGHARVPHAHIESEYKLGTWIFNRRQDHKSGKLEAGRVAQLEALPGWTWDALQAAWEEAFAALTAFVKREGHARVPQGHLESEFNLGSWVNTQRQFYKSEKREPERIARLEALPGWTWDARQDAWEEGFAALTAYVERESDARVSRGHFESGLNVGNWVKVQRRLFKSGKLEADRVARLEALPG